MGVQHEGEQRQAGHQKELLQSEGGQHLPAGQPEGGGHSAGIQEPREGQWREERDPEWVPLHDAQGCDHWDCVQDYTPWWRQCEGRGLERALE